MHSEHVNFEKYHYFKILELIWGKIQMPKIQKTFWARVTSGFVFWIFHCVLSHFWYIVLVMSIRCYFVLKYCFYHLWHKFWNCIDCQLKEIKVCLKKNRLAMQYWKWAKNAQKTMDFLKSDTLQDFIFQIVWLKSQI